MRIKLITVLAMGLVIGASSVALAGPFSVPVTTDKYNGNVVNGIPTPNATGLGYDLFNAANRLTGSSLTKNEQLDSRFIANDASWSITSATAFLIGKTAKNNNSIGVAAYNGSGAMTGMNNLFNGVTGFGWSGAGTIASPYSVSSFTPNPGDTVRPYSISIDWRDNTETTFYRDPVTVLLPDGIDHTVTYSLNGLAGKKVWGTDFAGILTEYTLSANTYLVGFEDRIFANYGAPFYGTAGDDDYNDVLILVDMQPLSSPLSLSSPLNNQVMGPAAVPEPATLTLAVAGFAGILLYGRRKRG
jgi:hypothetical protein